MRWYEMRWTEWAKCIVQQLDGWKEGEEGEHLVGTWYAWCWGWGVSDVPEWGGEM